MEKIRMQSVNLQKANAVMAEVKKAVIGKDTCILKVMAAMIAGGHILLDDIPGVGKTTMALAFSKAMDLKQNRVQFTPDILPADIVGFSMYAENLSISRELLCAIYFLRTKLTVHRRKPNRRFWKSWRRAA